MSPRNQAASEAFICWRNGATFRTEPAWIENIGSGGARLALSGHEVPEHDVWLSFVEATTGDWLPARVVGVSSASESESSLHVEFVNGCPYEILKALSRGGVSPIGQSRTRARSFQLAPDSLSFRVAREDTTPSPHQSFRLTTGLFGSRRPVLAGARPSPFPAHPEPVAHAGSSTPLSLPVEFPEPLPNLDEPPPPGALEQVLREGPLTVLDAHRSTRRQRNRANLLSSAVSVLSALSIFAVLWVALTQEYGKIRPLVVIYETFNE